jgi:hypothetical protein
VLQEGHCFSSVRVTSEATKYRAVDVGRVSEGPRPALAGIGNGIAADAADVIELKNGHEP